MYRDFIKNYPIVSIEDPFDQDDWQGYTDFTASVSEQVVGYVCFNYSTFSHSILNLFKHILKVY